MTKLFTAVFLSFFILFFSFGYNSVYAQDAYPAYTPDDYPPDYPVPPDYPPPPDYPAYPDYTPDDYPPDYPVPPDYPPPPDYPDYPDYTPDDYPPDYPAPPDYPPPPPDSYPDYPPDYPNYPVYPPPTDPPPCSDCTAEMPNTQAFVDSQCGGGCTAEEKAAFAVEYLESQGFEPTKTSNPEDGSVTVGCDNGGVIVFHDDLPPPPPPPPPDSYPDYPPPPPDSYPDYPPPPPDSYPDYPPPDYPDYPDYATSLYVSLAGRVLNTDPWNSISVNGVAPLNGVDFRASVFGDATGLIDYGFDCTNDGVYELQITATNNPFVAADLCNYPLVGNYLVRLRVQRQGIIVYATLPVHALSATTDVSIVFKSANSLSFSPGDNASFTYTVSNNGALPQTVDVGFWPVGSVDVPDCQVPKPGVLPGSPPAQTVSLNPGFSADVTFNFIAGSTTATAYAYASYDCFPVEANWANNIVARTYQVSNGAWFKAINGDVGSNNSVLVSLPPAGGDFTSQYLLAAGAVDSDATSQRWKLNNYSGSTYPQVSGRPYDYLRDRFRNKATNSTCTVGGLISAAFNYCSGVVTISGSMPAGSNYVWFIDGDLNLNGNFTVPADSTIIFIVRDNINVDTVVARADGIYVAGGTYKDTDAAAGIFGSQLTIEGAVYASEVNLTRVLGGPSCSLICNNSSDPAEIVDFKPRYIEALNSLLGSPSISWQEVAP